ncbi:hypothetical protein [Thiolapillus sp.]
MLKEFESEYPNVEGFAERVSRTVPVAVVIKDAYTLLLASRGQKGRSRGSGRYQSSRKADR